MTAKASEQKNASRRRTRPAARFRWMISRKMVGEKFRICIRISIPLPRRQKKTDPDIIHTIAWCSSWNTQYHLLMLSSLNAEIIHFRCSFNNVMKVKNKALGRVLLQENNQHFNTNT